MKNIQTKLIVLFIIALALPYFGISQDHSSNEIIYEVNKMYPSMSITKDELKNANTLTDLNKYYKSSWVKKYISVEISTTYKGRTKKAMSRSHTLTQEQKNSLLIADASKVIVVKVRYLPDNNLKNNEIKETSFKFTIEPDSDAKYVGGQPQLKKYLEKNGIHKIPENAVKEYGLAAVKFTVNEKGQIVNAHVFENSQDEKVDELLLTTIRNMPNWKPAEYATGLKVKQEYVLTLGDLKKSCVTNLLNLRPSPILD